MSRTNDITEMGEIGELAEYADVNDMQSTLTTSYTQRLQSNHSVDTAKDLTTNPDDQTVIAIDALESTPEQLQSMYENGSDPALLPETTNSTTNQASDSASSSSSLRSFAYQTPVRSDDIKTLLQVFVCNAMRSREADLNAEQIQSTCAALFSCDQPSESLFIIGNQNGELASTYPPQLLVPTHNRMPIDRKRLQQLIAKAKIARCRCRFPVPVILFNQKYICRSATLSGAHSFFILLKYRKY